jgi:hypothetical protein
MNYQLPKDGRLVRQIREPAGLFFWLGLMILGAGLFGTLSLDMLGILGRVAASAECMEDGSG